MKSILLLFLLLMLISLSSKAKVKATDVFIGYDHLCITLKNYKLLCKGNNKSGQAGLGKIKKSNQLKPVPRINSKIKKISVGGKKACALMDNGNIYCWNHIKNMRKVTPKRKLPSKVPRIKAVDLDCAKSFCCAASTKGEIKCWGKIGKYVIGEYNYLIKIGAFPSTLSKLGKNNKKVRIIGEPDPRKIKVQKKNNSWYIMDYDRKSDQLLIKQSKKYIPTTGFGGKKHVISYSLENSKFYRNHYGKKPNEKVILKNITKSSIVNGTGCFFVKNHYLHCMGNLWKSSVSGWEIKFISKLKAYRISNVKQVSAGYGYFCVLKNNNSVWCYDPIKSFSRSKIHFFKSGLKKMILGKNKSCALKANGSLWCWGKTFKNTTIYKPEILQPFDNSVSNFSMNENHACAIHKKGKIWCWGKNKFGQLGDSTRYYRNYPTLINYTKGFTDIKVGSSHTCGVKGNDSVYCWGNNNQGQVGGKKPMISKPKYVKNKRTDIHKLALNNN
ncbi:MAG: hypothetical protein PF693_09310, partial [Spirochaetia bacterium]|nr:hypothetical protein [Spirochaetia bacterium]